MSNTSPQTEISRLYTRSYANRDLGAFLIFFGLVGATPLYYLILNLIFKVPHIEWRIGAGIGVICIILGNYLIRHSHRHFKVIANGETGTIEVREGLWRHRISFDYDQNSKVRMAVADTGSGKKNEALNVMLVNGRHFFLIDSRPYSGLQETRLIAEFIAKATGCKLQIAMYGDLELPSSDLDLPFYRRVQKYPILLGEKPQHPEFCPISVDSLNGGIDRRYSWGLKANNLLGYLATMLMITLIISCIPCLGSADNYYSVMNLAIAGQRYEYIYALFAVFAAAALILCGVSSTVTVEGHRINTHSSFWGVQYHRHSMLIDDVEEISVRDAPNNSQLLFISDKKIVSVPISSTKLANYLASDIRYFIASRQLN